MNCNQQQTPGRDDVSPLSSATSTDVPTMAARKPEPEPASPTAATTADHPTYKPYQKVYHIPGYGRLRTAIIGNRWWALVDDAAKIAGLPLADITRLPPFRSLGIGSIFCFETFRTLKGTDDVEYRFVDVETLLPLCKTVRGGDYLNRFLLQHVLEPDSDARPLVFDEQAAPGQFTTAAGQFVSQRFYNDRAGEIRAIVTGTTAWHCAGSIARIMRVPVGNVVHLAGAGNSLTVQSKYLLTPIKPGSREVYIRPEAATRVMSASASLVSLAAEIEKWIDDELLTWKKLEDAGAVVSLHGLHRALAPASDYNDWLNAFVGPDRVRLYLALRADSIPITHAVRWVRKASYVGWIVWLLLRDGGVCHGGSVGETADEALVRIQPVFPDGNGKVSARALHAFLGTNRTFEAWLEGHSDQARPGQTATKNSSRVRGDVLLSEEEALALLLRSIKDPADFRTTLTPSTKL